MITYYILGLLTLMTLATMVLDNILTLEKELYLREVNEEKLYIKYIYVGLSVLFMYFYYTYYLIWKVTGGASPETMELFYKGIKSGVTFK